MAIKPQGMKSILITGSTDGIGKLAANKLAQAGHQVYVHGRSTSKIKSTVDEIKNTSSKNVFGIKADFSDLKEVEIFGEKITQEVPQLDVLINNAWIFKTAETDAIGALDIRFRVNYLAPYLLTRLLVPLLKRTGNARIINLSSAAQAPVYLKALIGKETLSVQQAYAQSKLALTMWSFELAKKEKDISVIAVNPGSLLNTKMVKEAYGHHWSSADKGASILCDLATSEEFEGISGRYFDNDKGDSRGAFAEAHLDACDTKKVADLLATTEQLLTGLSL